MSPSSPPAARTSRSPPASSWARTVEARLSHTYRKLGIRSRAALESRLPIARGEAGQTEGFPGFEGATLSPIIDGMVYVVERYLPGLSRISLLNDLTRLEQGENSNVRYLGSTIVIEDEACYCQFEGPTEAAVAEANREAGVSFDRIVPAVTVHPTRGDTR